MKTLVLGGAGFIGQHLVRALLRAGHDVYTIDRDQAALDRLMDSVDLLPLGGENMHDGEAIDTRSVAAPMVVDDHHDVVYNLAAKVGVQTAIREGLDVLKWNTETTAAALKLALGAAFIHASSSEVYGDNPDQPLDERKPIILPPPTDARWAYTYSKAFDEMVVLHSRPRSIVVRPFNVVGVGQNESYGAVLPAFVRAAVKGKALEVHGGMQTRTFVHVADVVQALLLLGTQAVQDKLPNCVYDIGVEDEITISSLAKRVVKITRSDSRIVKRSAPRVVVGCRQRTTTAQRLRDDTGWAPEHTLDEAINEIAASYRKEQCAS